MLGETGKPFSAYSIAGFITSSRSSEPKRSCMAIQPATAPGTLIGSTP